MKRKGERGNKKEEKRVNYVTPRAGQSNMLTVNIRKTLTDSHPQTSMLY